MSMWARMALRRTPPSPLDGRTPKRRSTKRMTQKYKVVYSNGDLCADNRRMFIMLYPNTSNELSDTKAGSPTTTTLQDMAEQLLGAGSINYYEIQRFTADDSHHKYPEISSDDNIDYEFEDYLLGTTDDYSDRKWCTDSTCDSIKDVIGAHTLVHDFGCSTSYASAEGGADNCGESAFSTGVMAWTPVPGACSDTGKGKNSVIQEPLHQFIRADQRYVNDLMCDTDEHRAAYDEHSLGKFDSDSGDATPMITYHESEYNNCGTCKSTDTDWSGGYTQTLTWCTEDAVYYTASDSCNDQSPNLC